MQLGHQCTRCKPDHHEDVVDATKVDRRVIVVVSVEVIVDVIVNLSIVILSREC
jgi:hypothetical protein